MVSGVGTREIAIVTPVGPEPYQSFYEELKVFLKPKSWTWIPVLDRAHGERNEIYGYAQTDPLMLYGKPSLARAYAAGLSYAWQAGFPKIIEVDLGHPVHLIPEVVRLLDEFPLVVGTRLDPLGSHGGPPLRRFLSHQGGALARRVFRLPFSDPTGGFIGFQEKILRLHDWQVPRLTQNYAWHIELKCRLRDVEAFYEIPFRSRPSPSGFRVFKAARDFLRVLRSPYA